MQDNLTDEGRPKLHTGHHSMDSGASSAGSVHLLGAEYTQTELKQWWKDSAIKWLANPRADSELLYVAYVGLQMSEPDLSQQCLEECRERRRRKR